MMHNLIKDLMRDLLVMAAREALGWRDVESVEIGLELSNRFEDNGWDGRVRLRLSGGRDFSYIFSAQELQYTCHPHGMIDGMRRAFDKEGTRWICDGSAWEKFDARVRVGDTAVLEAERRHTKEQAAVEQQKKTPPG